MLQGKIRVLAIGILIMFLQGCASHAIKKEVSFDPQEYFQNKHNSRHFTFYYQDNVKHIPAFAAFSDSLVQVIGNRYIPVELDSPIDFYVLKNRVEFKDFVRNRMGSAAVSEWGVYLPKENVLVTYENSGLGTFGHIITYPLMRDTLVHAPYWFHNGFATLFEKIYVYPDNRKLYLLYGFQNPWRIDELDKRIGLAAIRIDRIMHASPITDVSASEKRLLILFIAKNRKLGKYVDLVRKNQKNGYGTFLEAAFENDMKTIRKMWAVYMKNIIENKHAIMRIPPSQFFPSKEIFMQKAGNFLIANKL